MQSNICFSQTAKTGIVNLDISYLFSLQRVLMDAEGQDSPRYTRFRCVNSTAIHPTLNHHIASHHISKASRLRTTHSSNLHKVCRLFFVHGQASLFERLRLFPPASSKELCNFLCQKVCKTHSRNYKAHLFHTEIMQISILPRHYRVGGCGFHMRKAHLSQNGIHPPSPWHCIVQQ